MSEHRYFPMECDAHGATRWEGDLICSSCSKLYRSPEDDPYRFPSDCSCGARLAPGKYVDGKEVPFTARLVCRACAVARAGN